MRKTIAALTLSLLFAACAAAVVPEMPVVLLTGKDQTEYTLNEYTMDDASAIKTLREKAAIRRILSADDAQIIYFR